MGALLKPEGLLCTPTYAQSHGFFKYVFIVRLANGGSCSSGGVECIHAPEMIGERDMESCPSEDSLEGLRARMLL